MSVGQRINLSTRHELNTWPYLSLLTMTSTVLILAITYELSWMALLSVKSRSSVDRAPARSSGGHGFDFFLSSHIWTHALKWPCSPWNLVAQWIEGPPGVLEVMESILVAKSDLFFVQRSCHVDQSTFHLSLSSPKFTIFTHLLPHGMHFPEPIWRSL